MDNCVVVTMEQRRRMAAAGGVSEAAPPSRRTHAVETHITASAVRIRAYLVLQLLADLSTDDIRRVLRRVNTQLAERQPHRF